MNLGNEGKIVKLTMIQNNETGEGYDDDRADYIGKSGLLIFTTSKKQNPDKVYLQFLIKDSETGEIRRLKSTYGDRVEAAGTVHFSTPHSTYIFSSLHDLSKEEEKTFLDYAGKFINMLS